MSFDQLTFSSRISGVARDSRSVVRVHFFARGWPGPPHCSNAQAEIESYLVQHAAADDKTQKDFGSWSTPPLLAPARRGRGPTPPASASTLPCSVLAVLFMFLHFLVLHLLTVEGRSTMRYDCFNSDVFQRNPHPVTKYNVFPKVCQSLDF